MRANEKKIEQLALSHLLDIAWDEFDKSLLSASARFVLWGSFSSESELVARYFAAKGNSKLIDGRRSEKSRTAEENNLVDAVNSAANDVNVYLKWARNHGGGQPILREALVSYCGAFEACLKNVAVAFTLANDCPKGLDGAVFIPDEEFKRALKLVKEGWKTSGNPGQFRAQVFFNKFLLEGNPNQKRYSFNKEPQIKDWEVCWAAFDLRNAIVHQMAIPTEQLTLANTVFESYRELELTPKHLRVVADSMRNVLSPLNPFILI